jgi:hypothetical protein
VIIGAIVLVVAAAATTFVILDRQQPEGVQLVATIVPTVDIPANQLLDPLIEDGLFEEFTIPADWLVEGAVTDVRDLYGLRTVTPILANEQISRSRLTTSSPEAVGPPPRRLHAITLSASVCCPSFDPTRTTLATAWPWAQKRIAGQEHRQPRRGSQLTSRSSPLSPRTYASAEVGKTRTIITRRSARSLAARARAFSLTPSSFLRVAADG